MGNYFRLPFSRKGTKRKKLQLVYKQKFSGSIFYREIVQHVSEQYKLLENIQNWVICKHKNETFYYTEYNLNNYQQWDRIPQSLAEKSIDQLKDTIQNLLKQSYTFIDIKQIIDDQSRKQYENMYKYEQFKDDDTIIGSFIDCDMNIKIQYQDHRYMVSLLKDYQLFCKYIKQLFHQQSFVGKLSLKLKNKFYSVYNHSLFQPTLINSLIELINSIIAILYQTILAAINIAIQSNQQIISFYTPVNLHTLITSLLFADKQFNYYIRNTIIKCFHDQLVLHKKAAKYSQMDLINDLFNKKKSIRNPIIDLLTQQSKSSFYKTSKIFSAISRTIVPIDSLKMVHQLQKQIYKDYMHIMYDQHETTYTREKQCLVSKWLISNQHEGDIIAQLLITYWFTHNKYLKSQKGSSLIPLVQVCENILRIGSFISI